MRHMKKHEARRKTRGIARQPHPSVSRGTSVGLLGGQGEEQEGTHGEK